MSNETEFVSGLIVKAPNDKAPEYVKARLSIKRDELIAFLNTRDGEWLNVDIKVSQGGKWYAAVDNWKLNGNGTPRNNAPRPQRREPEPAYAADPNDDIPFATNRSAW
jgi:hypothetical protein